jgi:hypothetical protein
MKNKLDKITRKHQKNKLLLDTEIDAETKAFFEAIENILG